MRISRIAVLPVDNLSGGAAPVRELQQKLAEKLKEKGLTILPDETLESFMVRHRLRYVGGIDRAEAAAFKDETGVDAVLITSLELYNESKPPRIALTARFITTGSDPKILCMESTALAGDDRPGLFGLGMIEKPRVLRERALEQLVDALLGGGGHSRGRMALQPEVMFRPQTLEPGIPYRVAVMPFLNKSSRKYAGEILALHFIRELVNLGTLNVVEPGFLRQELLQYRVIMEDGLSLADAEIIFGMLKVDLLLAGNVNDYEDYQGSFGTPKVGFSALLLDRKTRKSVWAVNANNTGDDRVYLFDINKLNTANGLAAAMVRSAIESLYK